ncbi:MAG: ABC transporter permease [Thermoflavifilum sp.]|nr:ABC transporter permease [Thermoflavifilum sp.]MCL6512958.1 ABC transporter permease [Alicyclobacillus sp.]
MQQPSPVAPEAEQANKGRVSKSPTRLALERFLHNRAAVASLIILLLIILSAVFAPFITHASPTLQDLANTDSPPSALHPLGTDSNGTDYFARDLWGGRADLLVGFLGTASLLIISLVLGGLAGYYGKWVDAVVMRLVDFMMNFPTLLLIIVLMAILNTSSLWLLILVIALTAWPGMTRFIRGLFLNLREADYVLSAKMVGASTWRIIFKHMVPNIMGPLVVNATLTMANLIALEAALAVIGFGVQPPQPSWGNILNGAQDIFTLQFKPWAWIPPAGLISLTILCINFIGDGLRDAFDPSFER